MSPQRLRRQRTKGWRMPEGSVYVGRPTKWGNPWRVVKPVGDWLVREDEWCVEGDDGCRFLGFTSQQEATSFAIARYRQAIEHDREYGRNMLRFHFHELAELSGKDLVCWCGVGLPCHADVLLEVANAERVAS